MIITNKKQTTSNVRNIIFILVQNIVLNKCQTQIKVINKFQSIK